ncbi:hypothetical protein N7448_005677 [Penicillium atrosanguineum]|nr:hypothetical protein N7526_008549 [Penicillium atrosanguineum]KAJ5137123.1 hypothetical protein N7448_005677 [Penicillium atrosanguineum]
MVFRKTGYPLVLIRPDEMALMDPLTVDEVGDLMDELEKRKYSRSIIPIPHDPTLIVSGLSTDPVSGAIINLYKPKPPIIRSPTAPVKVKVKGQTQPQLSTPRKRRLEKSTTNDLLPAKRTRTAPATPLKSATPIIRTSSPRSEQKRLKGIPLPQSWESATAEDILLFKLKEYGGTWAEITAEWNSISGRSYASSTISNRWTKINSTLGDPPEKIWDLDSSMSC